MSVGDLVQLSAENIFFEMLAQSTNKSYMARQFSQMKLKWRLLMILLHSGHAYYLPRK